MKRKLSFLLVLVMVFTSISTSLIAFANEIQKVNENTDVLDIDFGSDGTITANSSLGAVSVKEFESAGGTANNPYKGVGTYKVKVGDTGYTTTGAKSLANTGLIEIDTSPYKAALVSELADGFSLEVGFVIPCAPTTRDGYIFGGTSGGGFGLRMSTAGELQFILRGDGSSYEICSLGKPSLGEYHHVAATLDTDKDTLSIFLDGALKVTKTGVSKLNPGTWNGKIMLFDTSSTQAGYQYAAPKDTIITDYHIYADALTEAESLATYSAAVNAMRNSQGPLVNIDFKADGTILANSTLGSLNVKEFSVAGGTANSPYKGVKNHTVKIGENIYRVAGAKSLANTGLIEIDTSPYKAALVSELADGFSLEVGFVIPCAPTTRDGYIFGGTSGGGFGLRMSTAGELQFILRGDGSSYEICSLGKPSLGEYHHVAATLDTDKDTLSIFLDGALKVTKTGVSKLNPGTWNGKIMLFDTSSTQAGYQYAAPKDTIITDYYIYADALTEAESLATYSAAVSKMAAVTSEDILDINFNEDGTLTSKSVLGNVSIKEYSDRNTALTEFAGIGKHTVKLGKNNYTVNGFKSSSESSFIKAETSLYKTDLLAELNNGFTIETGFVIPSGIDVSRDRFIVGAACGGGLGIRIAKTTGDLQFAIHDGTGYKTVSVARPADNKYHHVVANYNGDTDTMTLYLDGELVGTTEGVSKVNLGSWNGNFELCDSPASIASYTYALPKDTVITGLHIYSDVLNDEQSKEAYTEALSEMTFVPKGDIIELEFKADGTADIKQSGLGEVEVKEYSDRNNGLESFTGAGSKEVKMGSDKYSVNGFSSPSNSSFINIGTSAYATDLLEELNDGFSIELGFVIPKGIDTSRARYILGATNGGGLGIKIAKTTGNLEFDIHDGTGYKTVSVARPEDNKYHHVVANYNGDTDTMTLYLDGELVGTTEGVTKVHKGSWNGNFNLLDTTSSIVSYNYAMPAGTVITGLHIYNDTLTEGESKAAYTASLAKMTLIPKVDIIELEFKADGTADIKQSGLGEVEVKEYSNRDTQLSDYPGISTQVIKVGSEKYNANVFKSITPSSFMNIGTGAYATELISELNDGFSIELGFVIPKGIDTSRPRYILGATNGGGLGIKIAKTTGNFEFDIHDGTGYKTVSVARPEDNKYHHVVANYNGDTDTMTLYLDGELVGTTEGVVKVHKGSWNGNFNLLDTTSSIVSYNYAMPAGTAVTNLHIYADSLTDSESKAAYTAAVSAFTPYEKVYDDDFEPVVRFMVTSDIHIGSASDPTVRTAKFANALNAAYNIADSAGNHYDGLDLIAIAGDLAENGYVTQWQEGKKVMDAYVEDDTDILVVTGNHEYYDDANQAIDAFEGVFGNGSANTATKVNGYWFIGVSSSSDGWGYTAKDVKFVEDALKVATADDPNGEKPIFIFHHIGNLNTVFGTDSKGQYPGLTAFDKLYSNYPQVVSFSGHTHKPINDEASIYQDKYTSLSTGTLYYTLMSKADNVSPTVIGGSTYDIAQFYIVEVDANNRTRIRVYDFNQNKFVGETYLLESYKPEDFVYNEKRFEDKEIFFEDDAQINIKKATQNLVVFEFEPVASDSFTARDYKIVVEDMNGNEVASKYVGWTYYEEDYETMLSTAIAGLKGGTEYTIKIYGVNSMYLEGITDEAKVSANPLTATFKTAEAVENAVADLMDIKVDSNSDTVTDISGNDITLTPWGDLKTGFDPAIGMDFVSFDGNSNIKVSDFLNDKEDLIYGFTYEGYFKVDDFSNCSEYLRGVMAMEHSGGFGFDIYEDKTATFQVYTNGYKTVTKTLEEGKYYHWVCVYNGEELTCYINGNRMTSVKTDTPITFLTDDAMKMYLGGDTTATGGWERLSETSIAIARLYSEPMSEEQALKLWEDVRALQDTELYPDDSNDPEYLRWESVDDDDTDYVTFFDSKGNIHDHAIDENSFDVYPMYNGAVSYFIGSHYYEGSAHFLTGDVRAKLGFTGTAFRYIVRFRGPAADGYGDEVDVYIDGEYYTTVSNLNGANLTSRVCVLEVTDLPDKAHEITFVSSDGRRVPIDEFQVVLGVGADSEGEEEVPDAPVRDYYVKDKANKTTKAPKIDGTITEKEWGKPIIVSGPAHASETWKDGYWAFDPNNINSNQTAKVYLTADDEFIYIGATLDKCELDNSCETPADLYKAAHFNFSVSNWNDETTVERIPFEGDDYEQYTGFMLGLVNGNKASYTFTQGLEAWELKESYYTVSYDENTQTYTYEVKVPISRTNIVSDKIALSASIGTAYTEGDAANRYNFTTGSALCGGAYNWAHFENALPVTIAGLIEKEEPEQGDNEVVPEEKAEDPYVGKSSKYTGKAPKIDGTITEKEWGKPIVVTNPEHASNTWEGGYWAFDPESININQNAKLYITRDENFIYVGATLDKCDLDTTCTNLYDLYKSAHFNFTISNWNNDTTVERIPFEGDDYEQYTGFMFGLVNGKKASYTFTQGLEAWELNESYYEITYNEQTRTYTYEAMIPISRTNIVSDKVALSASLGAPYTGGDAANRYNFTTGSALCGGAYNWAHLNNALEISFEGSPNTSDSINIVALIAIAVCSIGVMIPVIRRKVLNAKR